MPPKSACIQCHAKKRRCDAQAPVCDRCRRLELDCRYPTSRKKTGPKRAHLEPLLTKMGMLLHIFFLKKITCTKYLLHIAEIEEAMNTDSIYRPSSSVEQDDESSSVSGELIMSLQDQSGLQTITDSLDLELGWMGSFPTVETGLPQKSSSDL